MIREDLRNFLRSLRRDFFHWGLATLILGTAVGMTATVYTLTDKLTRHPLPVSNLDRVVTLGGLASDKLPTHDPVEWWKQAHSLEYLALVRSGQTDVRINGWRGPANVEEVSNEFFSVFGATVLRGRDFGQEDEQSGKSHVLILSYTFWKAHSQGEQLSLGSTVQLNREPYVVVGIAPDSLDGLGVDLWVPRPLDSIDSIKLSPDPSLMSHFSSIGRLRKGATVTQAHEELMDLLHRLNTLYTPKSHARYGEVISVNLFEANFGRGYEPALRALFAGSVLILLIAGADCSGFLIGRAVGRTKEVAIRRVLGASRLDILRQALIEAGCLGLLSGMLGVAVEKIIVLGCQMAFPVYFVRLRNRTLIDSHVFLGCMVVGIFIGVLAGWLPAKKVAKEDFTRAMKEDCGPLVSSRGKWLRAGTVLLQVAFTFVLVMGATLTLETARNLFGKDKGFNVSGVIAMHMSIPLSQIPTNAGLALKQTVNQARNQAVDGKSETQSLSSPEAEGRIKSLNAKETEILNAISSIPGVEGAAFTDQLPIVSPIGGVYVGGSSINNYVMFRGAVSADYFRALGIRFVSGRTFSSSPTHEVVIEESAARSLWPGQNPLGETMVLSGTAGKDDVRVVVGIVNDTRSVEIATNPPAQFYLPLDTAQNLGGDALSAYVVLQWQLASGEITPELMTALSKVGADDYVDRIAPLTEFSRAVTEPLWIRTTLLSFYAFIGLVLALSGVFVLSSYLSQIRRQEIGIRMALGAGRAELIFQITREGIVATIVGLALGATLWLSAAQVLRNLLYGVTTLDPATFLSVGSLIFLVMLLASSLPAFLAVFRQNPANLLRVL